MTDELRAQIEAQAQSHEAERDRLLMEANQHQGAVLALRALLAAPQPTEAKEQETNG